MSIRNLDHFLSKEDFGDAHDPLFDGTNTPPNVNTQASEIKAHSPESETNNTVTDTSDTQVPEPSEENPATAGDPARDDGTDAAVPPKASAPLAHDTVEANEKAQTATTAAKTALEAFAPQARRAELIGFTKRQQADLGIAIKSIRRAAGIRGEFGISVESINEAIAVGNKHLARLTAEAGLLKAKVSTEARDDIELLQESGVSGADIAEFQRTQTEGVTIPAPLVQSGVVDPDDLLEPLAHPGATPLPMADALAITETELAHDSVMSELEVLQDGQAAIESYLELIRGAGKKGISKQAAAIMHTGLMNIDAACGLRVRTTGLEAFNTSPRSALETVSIEEASLMQRGRELGAKILQKIMELLDRLIEEGQKLTTGIHGVRNYVNQMEPVIASLKGEPLQDTVPIAKSSVAWLDGKFVGDHVTPGEYDAYRAFEMGIKFLEADMLSPLKTQLQKGCTPETLATVEKMLEEQKSQFASAKAIELPGGMTVKFGGGRTEVTHGDSQPGSETSVPTPALSEVRKNWQNVAKFSETVKADDTYTVVNRFKKEIPTAVTGLRKGSDFNEEVFQKIQVATLEMITFAFGNRGHYQAISALSTNLKSKIQFYKQVIYTYKAVDKEA